MDTGTHSTDSPLAGQTSIATRRQAGRQLVLAATVLMLAAFVMQTLYALGVLSFGFANWRPLVYVYMLWAIALCTGQVMMRGEEGRRALFILPAVLFTVAVVVFPTIFALFVSFTDWNLAARTGPHFNGLDNFVGLLSDGYFWNAIGNMVFYLSTVVVQYAIAFGLALLLNAEIKGRRFFRVVFLLPFMLSPVAVAWMIGRSMMDLRSGPISHFMRLLGWDDPSFFTSPWTARFTVAALDAWVWIPFMTILLLAGLQAMSKEVREAAKVDGATPWQAFWQITFPLMLPISITAILVRVIFLLKLADIVISATAGGPGGATDTVSSFIFRETRDRANVGYGTMLAMVYLVMIVLFLSALLKLTARFRTQEQELS
jgi:multiple sugar transport system permease protein